MVLPASASWLRGRRHGHQQRAARAARAPRARPAGPGARRHRDPLRARRAAWARTWATRPPRRSGTSCARSARCTRGMSYARLEELGGLQWPCSDEDAPGRALPPRAPLGGAGRAARARRSAAVEHEPPVDALDERLPAPPDHRPAARLVQHRRADGGYTSPLRRGETLDLSPEDARALRRARRRAGARDARAADRWSRRCASTARCGPDWPS